MIDLAATAALIQNLKNNGFTSAEQKLIAILLANVEQGQQCEIIEILELHAPHCRKILKRFTEKKLLSTFGRGAVFYRFTGAVSDHVESVSDHVESVGEHCSTHLHHVLLLHAAAHGIAHRKHLFHLGGFFRRTLIRRSTEDCPAHVEHLCHAVITRRLSVRFGIEIIVQHINSRPATFFRAKTALGTLIVINDDSAVGRSPAIVKIVAATIVAATVARTGYGNFSRSVRIVAVTVERLVEYRHVRFYVTDCLYGTTLESVDSQIA